MKRLLTSLFVVHALACSLMAQTKTVLKTPATNALTESLVVPSGKTLTIASGATINATGATVTGFTASAAWADITGKPSTFPPEAHTQAISTITGLQDALDAKAATSALSSYLPLTGGTLTGSLTGTSFVSAGTIFPTRTITITGGQSLTWNDTNGTGFSVTVRPDSPSANQIVNFNPNGNIVTTADTGRVTSTMILDGTIAADDIADAAITNAKLAGSIALSKLAITGTPDGTKFIRDDGSYQAINLSGYLPLTGGTLTGPLILPAGTVGAPALTTTGDTDTGLNFPAADTVGITTAGSQRATFSVTGGLGTLTLHSASGAAVYTASGVSIAQLGTSSISASFCGLWNVTAATGILSSSNRAYALRFGSDCSLAGDAANVFQVGVDHATTATNQAVKAHDTTTGTGAALDLRGGNGSTAGGAVTLSTSATTTPAVRMTIKASGVINMSGMPTSSAGLSSGDLWNDSGTVKIVP